MRRTRVKASTIHGQLNRIVLVPSLCFLALWLIVAAVGTVQAVRLMGTVAQAREGTEVFADAVRELRAERRMSLVHLGRSEAGDTVDTDALDGRRTRTDAAVADAVGFAGRLKATRDDEVRRSAEAFTEAIEDLPALRAALDDGSAVQEQILVGYAELLDGAASVTTALVHTTDGGENLTDAVLTSQLLRVSTEYSTADALLAGVAARGTMGYEETAHFTYLTASYRDTLAETASLLDPSVDVLREEMVADPSWTRAEELSRGVVTRSPTVTTDGPGPSPGWNTVIDIDGADWDESSGVAVALIDNLTRAQTDRTVDLAWKAALTQVSLGVGAALICLAGGIMALATVGRSSRRLTDRLALLRERVMERDDDLPGIIERAQRGDRVDAQEELPPLNEFGDDEIGQVAEAFDSAQLTAVEAAVRQAEIRRGANKAFLGIAFRNQNLVQRQLRLLDEIEYDEQDPEALERLFRLDHLTTRARRYADNLIILGGGQSVRRWRQPRPLVDVLRAAIAETEDFERVRLTSAPRMLMHGQAVADIVHLLAELIENATQFSPAGTPVDVGCGPCPEGILVEVEDRGLGMSERGYEQARRTLSQPPEFDVMVLPDDPRLGLFVVARLAERHGVRVWLEPSPYGGTRAVTLIPKSLLESAEVSEATGPHAVVPSEENLVEGDVRRTFGLLDPRPAPAATGVRSGHGVKRRGEPAGGPTLRPVGADAPDPDDPVPHVPAGYGGSSGHQGLHADRSRPSASRTVVPGTVPQTVLGDDLPGTGAVVPGAPRGRGAVVSAASGDGRGEPAPAQGRSTASRTAFGEADEADLFAEPPAFGDAPAAEPPPRHCAGAGSDGVRSEPDPAGQWDVRWGNTGPQETVGGAGRHTAAPPRTGSFPSVASPSVSATRNGYPGDPTEPLPHVESDQSRPEPDRPAPESGLENDRGTNRDDPPSGNSGPPPVPANLIHRITPRPDGAHTAPSPSPEAIGAFPAPDRAPLPKRPVSRERDTSRVPDPAPPGGHDEP